MSERDPKLVRIGGHIRALQAKVWEEGVTAYAVKTYGYMFVPIGNTTFIELPAFTDIDKLPRSKCKNLAAQRVMRCIAPQLRTHVLGTPEDLDAILREYYSE